MSGVLPPKIQSPTRWGEARLLFQLGEDRTKALLGRASHLLNGGSEFPEHPSELREHFLALVWKITHAVGSPWHIHIAEDIEVGTTGAGRLLNPAGRRLVVVPSVSDGACMCASD